MAQGSNHAIVYGASGLIGWALVDELLKSYPQTGSFSKITAVTNRPLNVSQSCWPEPKLDRPDLQLASGIDLRRYSGDTLTELLKKALPDIRSVTHIYYLVFTAVDDDVEEVATNLDMFQKVIDTHNMLSPLLQFVAFPGGTRGYGIYVPGGTFTPPLHEDMVENLPPDYAKTVVYPAYRKLLDRASQGKKWTWCEIGFTPNGSQYSLALHWAQYLSLYAYNQGIGPHAQKAETADATIPFPGNRASAESKFSPVSSNTIARFMIYASLHPNICGGGQLFNISDSETPYTYGEIWPKLAAWFKLVGVEPLEDTAQDNALRVGEVPDAAANLAPGEYTAKHRDIFARHELSNAVRGGVGAGNRQLDSVGYWLTFDRQMSIKKLRATGFEGDSDLVQSWLRSFEMFRDAGLVL